MRHQPVRGVRRVEGEVQLDDLVDGLATRVAVGLLGVEVEQEAAEAVVAAALGRDVGLDPFVSQLRDGKDLVLSIPSWSRKPTW